MASLLVIVRLLKKQYSRKFSVAPGSVRELRDPTRFGTRPRRGQEQNRQRTARQRSGSQSAQVRQQRGGKMRESLVSRRTGHAHRRGLQRTR